MGKLLALAAIAIGVAACGDDGMPQVSDVVVMIDTGPPALSNATSVTFTFYSTPAENGGFLCQLDQGAAGECSSPYTATVGEGDHTFAVAALDTRSQPGVSTTRNFRIDLTPPDTTITRAPAAIDQDATPEFEFTGSDTGGGTLTFECNIDAVSYVECTSPVLLDLGEGEHVFLIRAIDAAGNADPDPASHTWVVDTSSPDTTITSGPDDASTSGPTPTFTFTSDQPATFECKVDAAAFATCTTPFTITPPLTDGAHAFEVRAVDTNSVVDPTPATRAWIVDATPPDVTITSTPANPSNDATPTFTLASSDATATFECSLNTQPFAACTTPVTTNVPDGSNTFRARAVDPAGNRTATPASYSWFVDTLGPTVTITGAPAASSNDPTPTVTFSTTGGPTSITCAVDGGAPVPCTSPFTASALGEGNHSITVTVADAAGNSAMATAMFAIDLTPPAVMITMSPANPTNNPVGTIAFTTTGTTVTCQLDGGGFTPCTSPVSTGALGDGSHTFEVRAADAVGNLQTASATWVVDTSPPSVSITSAPPNPTNDDTPTFVFTTSGSPTSITCQVDGGGFAPCSSPFTTAMLTNGAHTVQIRATDAAGNFSTVSRTFTVDTVGPVVTITSEPPDPTTDDTPTVLFTVTGPGIVSIQCALDGGAFGPCTTPGSFTTASLADGFHEMRIRATDDAGNATIALSDFTIDTGAPVVTITSGPPNPTNDNTATVTFTVSGTFTSLQCQIDSGAFATCTSPFTTPVLLDGTHTITVRATDGAGNPGQAFRTFVVDTTAPVITITIPPVNPFNDNTPTTTFTVTGGAFSIQCAVDGGAFAPCSSPFTTGTLPDGAHSVTIRAADDVGNTDLETTNFVIDTVAPPLTLNGVPSLTNDNTPSVTFSSDGTQSGFQCRIDLGAFVGCTSPFTTGTLADGTHTITVRVRDAATNFFDRTTTFDVDATAPTVVFVTQPPAHVSDDTPTVTFTTGGSPTIVECAVDGGAFSACAMTFTAPTLTQGAHSITVRVIDAATNASQITANFTVDTIPPVVNITTTFPTPTNNVRPPISFTATGATSVQCQIDGGAFATCTSAFTPGFDLAQGAHTITVRGTDLAGNQGTDSVTFTVDSIAPTVAFASTPANPSNDPAPIFTFNTSGSPSTIECRLAPAAFAPCSSPYTPGTLVDGSYTVQVRVTDSASNASTITYAWIIDTVAPTVTLVSVPPTFTNDPTATVTFTVTGSPSTTQCRIDSGAFAPCTSGFTTPVLTDGLHTITVRVTDAATNFAEASTSFTVDTVLPALTITSQPPNPTNDATADVTFTAEPGATVTCQVDSGAFGTCSSPFATAALAEGTHVINVRAVDAATNVQNRSTGNFVVDLTAPVVTITNPPSPTNDTTPTFAFTGPGATSFTCQIDSGAPVTCTSPFVPTLTDGSYVITVRGTDAAGNTGLDTSPVTIDTVPPSIVITTPPPANTNDNTPTLSAVVMNGPATTTCRVDSGSFTACTLPFTPAALADGPHTIQIRATDTAGNQATDSATFTVDTQAPTVTLTPVPTPTNDATPTVTWTQLADATVIECQLDGGGFSACTSPFTITPALSEASHTFSVRATDAALNSDTKSTTFTVDLTAPVVTITDPPSPTNDSTPSFAFSAPGATSFTCQVGSGAQTTCTSPFTPALTDGTHVITVRGTDAAGNTGLDTSTVVVDTVAPTVTITSGPRNGHPTGDSPQTFDFTHDGASTQCRVDAGVFAPCTSPFTTGTLLAGTHTITIRSTDAAGNASDGVATNVLDPTSKCLNGTSTDGQVADITPVVPAADATIEFWHRAEIDLSENLVDFRSQNGSFWRISFDNAATGTMTVDVQTVAGMITSRDYVMSAAFDIRDWHHIAVVATSTATRLYIDGTEVAGTGDTHPGFGETFAVSTEAITMNIGRAVDMGPPYAFGVIRSIRLSPSARYSTTFTPAFPLVATGASLLYRVDEGTGSTSTNAVAMTHPVTWSDAVWGVCFP